MPYYEQALTAAEQLRSIDAKILSTLRSAMQLTQSDMAKRLDICLRLYSDYEHGKKPIMQLVQWRIEQLYSELLVTPADSDGHLHLQKK